MPSVSIRRPNWLRHAEKVHSRAALSPAVLEVPNSPAALDHSPAGVLYRRTAEDLAVMPVSLQVQVKAQTVVKLQKMVERSLLTQEEFEIWKRRIMML